MAQIIRPSSHLGTSDTLLISNQSPRASRLYSLDVARLPCLDDDRGVVRGELTSEILQLYMSYT